MRIRTMGLAAAQVLTAGVVLAREERVELKSADTVHVAPLSLASLNRTAQLAVTGTPGKTGFIPALDRVTGTSYQAKEPGKVDLTFSFARAQRLRQLRLLLGEGEYTWSLVAADSLPELEDGRGSVSVAEPRKTVSLGDTWSQLRLELSAPARAMRLSIEPAEPARHVVVREVSLIGDQTLQSIEVASPSSSLRFHDYHPLTVVGYFSGGERTAITSKGLEWEIEPAAAARMSTHQRLWTRRPGPFQVRARFGKLVSPALGLEVE